MLPSGFRALLRKQSYGIVGGHSAVKVCEWTKKSVLDKGHCYKEQFYGIESHRCMEMTPSVGFCNHRCIFCWRQVEHTIANDMDGVEEDEPNTIIDGCIEARRKLLIGFKGNEKADKKKLEEALVPKHAAISLAGEPTLYGQISELIDAFHKRNMTTFLVTNGTRPDRLGACSEPTQLYLSLDAPDEKVYTSLDRPAVPASWEKISQSLELMPSLSCQKVVRLTLVKGYNMCNPKGYADLIRKASPDFVELKAFMLIGGARNRLKLKNMPRHEEVTAFSGELAEHLDYPLVDEKADSRVVLLARKDLKPGQYKIKY